MPKIVIMAGGTGGHVFPGLAVAAELKQLGWTVEWFGTKDRMEADTVPKYGFPIHFLDIAGVRGKGLMRKLLSPFHLFSAVLSARKILTSISPDLVLGMGGYASGPGGLAARMLNIPLFIHEQNAVFGLTNRLLAKFADKVFTGFDVSKNTDDSKAPKHCIWVGNPVRAEFFETYSDSVTENTDKNVEQAPIKVLITGGSLGAQALNQQVPHVLSDLSETFPMSVWHQTGKGKLTDVEGKYSKTLDVRSEEFINDTAIAYAWADIIICRAGALTVAEVSASGRPAIFVPLPIAVDDHQTKNASILVNAGAAFIVNQNDIPTLLSKYLKEILSSTHMRQTMAKMARMQSKQYAAKQLAEYCQQVVGDKYQ